MSYNWSLITHEEASKLLFNRCIELLIINAKKIENDPNIRILVQRLYGDYRQVKNTKEYARAEKYVFYFKNTGLGKELF